MLQGYDESKTGLEVLSYFMLFEENTMKNL
jgi:hypothetical protein